MVAPHGPNHRPAAKATVCVIQNDHGSSARGEEVETATRAILGGVNLPDHERQCKHRATLRGARLGAPDRLRDRVRVRGRRGRRVPLQELIDRLYYKPRVVPHGNVAAAQECQRLDPSYLPS
jgi:hypothetical protein